MLISFMFITCFPKAINMENQSVRIMLDDSTVTLGIKDVCGVNVCVSSNNAVATADSLGVVTPVGDGTAVISCTDEALDGCPMRGGNTITANVVVNKNGTLNADAQTFINGLTKVDVPFISALHDKVFIKPFGQHEYGSELLDEALTALIPADKRTSYVIERSEITANSVNIKVKKLMTVGQSNISLATTSKTLPINYKNVVDTELAAINQAKAKIKPKYYAYLNDLYEDMLETSDASFRDILIEASEFKSDLGNDAIEYEIDARNGDNSPYNAMFGGYMRLKINDTLYDVVEIEFHKAFKIPKVKQGETVEEVVKKYFEDHLIGSNEKVEVEYIEPESPDGEGFYRATVTPKSNASLMGMISNLLLPKLNAADEKVVSFEVVQDEAMVLPNPNTSDNSRIYIGFLIISSVVLLAVALKTKKIND